MGRGRPLATLAAVGLLALTAAAVAHGPGTAEAGTAVRACKGLRVGLLAPLTGPAAASGQEQLRWARFAVRRYNRAHPRLPFKLVEHDTAFDAGQAHARAVQLAADGRVMAVAGPAGSQEVPAVGTALAPKGIAFVSGSARAPELTAGPGRARGFFRVVASDLAQAPLLASFAAKDLGARRVAVVDDRTAYGAALAAAAHKRLLALGADVSRRSLDPQHADYDALVESIPERVEVILLLWSSAGQARTFHARLRADGRKATVLGGDRLDAAEWISGADGQYFVSFAPDLRSYSDAGTVSLLREYVREFGPVESKYGPPVFVALQVVQKALERACRDGRASRAEVQRHIRAVRFGSILRYTVRFRGGDVPQARFFVYRVASGTATMVR